MLCEHKVCHNFWDSLNSICNCSSAIESIKHYSLHHSNFKDEGQSHLQNVRIVKQNLLLMNKDVLTHSLLYGNNTLTDNSEEDNSTSQCLGNIPAFCLHFEEPWKLSALIPPVFHVGDRGWEKIGTQKNSNTILSRDKFYSLKAHPHFFFVLIYLAT